MLKACYRELLSYKYQLMENYSMQIDICPQSDINLAFLSLTTNGLLTIKKDYAWDGPSGPTIDSKNFMRASLVHDALYQLMRLSVLDYQVHRQRTDEYLRELCLADGMSAFRAWYSYQAVRLFGEANARPRNQPEVEIICAP